MVYISRTFTEVTPKQYRESPVAVAKGIGTDEFRKQVNRAT
jgi:hypothetical protein